MTRWIERIELTEVWDAFEEDQFVQARDAIVARLRASQWVQHYAEPDLIERVGSLAVAKDIEEFDSEWGIILYAADRDKVCLSTMGI